MYLSVNYQDIEEHIDECTSIHGSIFDYERIDAILHQVSKQTQ